MEQILAPDAHDAAVAVCRDDQPTKGEEKGARQSLIALSAVAVLTHAPDHSKHPADHSVPVMLLLCFVMVYVSIVL